MSIIASTNSTCHIDKIEYRGVEAIVYLKILAFARTLPEKGLMIYFKDAKEDILKPAFRVASEDDTYQNKIFWVNTSNLTGHTYQNVGMEAIIPVHINLSEGIYKNNHLYREVTIVIVDYQNEKKTLWESQPLHLCSEPLNFNIIGDIIPKFLRYEVDDTPYYRLSIDYKFSEDSWLFNLHNPDIVLEMSVAVKQSVEFETLETVMPSTSGTWNDVCAELEETAHVTISAKLKFNQSILWQDKITCVPGELATVYIKQNNNIYIVTHKALQHNALTRDTHIYHPFNNTYELYLLIVPWENTDGTQRKGAESQPLYTIAPYLTDVYGKYIPCKNYFMLPPLSISKVYCDSYNSEITIPHNITSDISEDFPVIIYNNYQVNVAEQILSQMILAESSLKITIQGITATKQPLLIVSSEVDDYKVGDSLKHGIFVGDSENNSLVVQEGELTNA